MQSGQSAGWVPLFDSESAIPTGSVWLGPVDPSDVVRCTLRLRPGLHTGADPFDSAHTAAARDPDDDFGGSFGEPPGADLDDLDRIRDFAGQTKLEIVEIDPEGRRVVLSGSAAVVTGAFLAQLARYKRGGKVRLGFIAPLYVPAAIANAVEEVSALEAVPSDSRTPIPEPHTAWRPEGRRFVVPAVALIAGAALGVALYGGLLPQHPSPSSTPARPPQRPTPAASPVLQNTLQEMETAGWKFLDAGHLREAQDSFLRVLAIDPDRTRAMQGLVAVRRKMAGDNPDVVRRQVALYQDAVARGGAPGEYYTPSAIKLLVAAGQRALREIEAQGERMAVSGPAPAPAPAPSNRQGARTPSARTQDPRTGQPAHPVTNSTQPVPPRRNPQPAAVPPKAQDRATPAPAAEAQKPPAAAPQRPAPTTSPGSGPAPATPQTQRSPATPAPQSPPATTARPSPPAAPPVPAAQAAPVVATPQTPPPAPSRFYAIRIGPVADRDRAAAIAKRLSSDGFAQAQINTQTGYRVVSEPLPRKEAEGLLTALAGRGVHGYLGPAAGDTVQVVFGTVATQRDADTLSARIAAAGYDAWIREATVYTVHVGPYPSDSVTKITDLVKAVASEAAIVADPVSPPAATAPAVSSPQAPASPSGAQVAPPPPALQAAAPAANRLYAIQIGPVSDRDRAGAIAKRLAAAGFSQAQITAQTGYRVVSEPLPRTEAAGVVAALAAKGIHGYVETATGDTAQIIFGVVTTQKDAEALSARVTAAGYDAWTREATVYVLRVGPYPSASVDAITGLIKAGAPEGIVIVNPVP